MTGLATGTRDVELVLDFLNTVDLEAGTDVLDDETSWLHWARSRHLDAGGGTQRARMARDALRAAVDDPLGTQRSGDTGTVLRVRLQGGMPTLTPVDTVGAVLAAATRLAVLGEWERIKICPADDCRWAFFDRSRNRSRTWCSMRVCGNREKARAWRERTRSALAG